MSNAESIDREAPLTLQAAAERAFPDGTMTVRTLRAERDRGRLETWIMGKREYTTLAAISRMIEACRAAQKARRSASVDEEAMAPSTEAPNPQPGAALRSLERLRDRLDQKKQAKASDPSGSYSTEEGKLALAFAKETVKRLRENSRAASKKSGSKQPGKAIRRKP